MLVCMIPGFAMTASAETPQYDYDTSWYESGTVADGNKYYIYDAEDLLGLSYLLNPANSGTDTARPFSGKKEIEFHIMNDIDLNPGWDASSGTGATNQWLLNSKCNFASRIYGHGHTVKGIYFTTTSGSRGIFGEIYGRTTEIKDLNIENSYYESSGNNSAFFFGNVQASPTLTIENVRVNATLKHTCAAGNIGAFIGWNDSNGNQTANISIKNSVFDGIIDATYTGNGNSGVGGFIAGNNSSSSNIKIENCASYVEVKGSGASDSNVFVGGFVGLSFNGKITVKDSVSSLSSTVNCDGKNNVGGVVGVMRFPSTGVMNMLALSNVYCSGNRAAVPEVFKQNTTTYEASGNNYNTVVGSLETVYANADIATAASAWGWRAMANGKPVPATVNANVDVACSIFDTVNETDATYDTFTQVSLEKNANNLYDMRFVVLLKDRAACDGVVFDVTAARGGVSGATLHSDVIDQCYKTVVEVRADGNAEHTAAGDGYYVICVINNVDLSADTSFAIRANAVDENGEIIVQSRLVNFDVPAVLD